MIPENENAPKEKIGIRNVPDINPDTEGCGLCIECDNECLSCDTCPDLPKGLLPLPFVQEL